jgi:hypothetical protein
MRPLRSPQVGVTSKHVGGMTDEWVDGQMGERWMDGWMNG